MKTSKIILIILCGLFSQVLAFPSMTSQFEEANRLYEAGKFAEALALYHQIEKEGAHWKLYFNIGNSYYKLNQFIEAKIYYLRAQRLKPFERSIQKNITIVNKNFDEVEQHPTDFFARLLLKIDSLIPLNVISILLVIFVFLLNGFLYLLIKKGAKKVIVYGLFFSLALGSFITFYHIYRVDKINTRDTAVIVKENSELRSGPGRENTILFKVNPGIKVKIIDQSRQWLQVSASEQIAGWIEEEQLERI